MVTRYNVPQGDWSDPRKVQAEGRILRPGDPHYEERMAEVELVRHLLPRPLPLMDDRIRVTGILRDDPAPLEVGEEGTVSGTMEGGGIAQIYVRWDSGRTLTLLREDPWEVISSPRTEEHS